MFCGTLESTGYIKLVIIVPLISLHKLKKESMMDDWKDEILPRLEKSQIYGALKTKCSAKDSEVIALTDEAVAYAFQRTKSIMRHMGEFTLHDSDHLFKVLNLMELLLGDENIRHLSIPELLLLVISAFFHDIGMAPDEKQVVAYKKIWDLSTSFADREEESSFNEFKRFYSARPDQQEIIEDLIEQGQISQAETIKGYLLTDFIRQTHADRAREIIGRHWNDKIKFRDTELTVELAQICYSHNDDTLSLLELDKNLCPCRCSKKRRRCRVLSPATCYALAGVLRSDAVAGCYHLQL